MIALTPQFILLTTGVGVLMIHVGLGLLQGRSADPIDGDGHLADSGFRYRVVSVPVF